MSDTDKSWLEYLNNRLNVLDESQQEERDYLKGEINKIKKTNKDEGPS